jgi:putative spermidine/putrescine transport system substrate-binding protein
MMVGKRRLLNMTRRSFARSGLAGLVAAGAMPWLPRTARAAESLTLADIGVGDTGDWSRFAAATGRDVSVVSMGNAPAAVVNQLLAGGGLQTFDIINIVGGMQEPLVQNDLIRPLDVTRLSNWSDNSFIEDYLADGTPGFDFIGYDGQVYGVPTVLQGDSFAYLPDETGPLDSYGALFDERFRGLVALEDNYTTAGQKTALFLNASGQADIADPADMSPEEVRAVVDFLIEQKRAGQFRVIWSSFEQAVGLLTSREVHVMDCWEPMVFAARDQGVNAEYAAPREGYLLWAMAAYIVSNPQRTEDDLDATYALLDFMLDGWYGAQITLMRGYMTNPKAAEFAAANSDIFGEEQAARVDEITEGVKAKFEAGGTWQNRWPTHVDVYEEEWQRFKAA